MIPNLEQTFRWFGPTDPVTLKGIRQTGATGIVTALHHIPNGDIWPLEEIEKRKDEVAAAGLEWSVVESVNIHNSIRIASADRDQYIDNYLKTLHHLAEAGLKIVCYNFMPVLDWTRTNLDYRLPSGGSALRCDTNAIAAFDLYILERPEAFAEFTPKQQETAKAYFDSLNSEQKTALTNIIMAGLPGTHEVIAIDEFKKHLAQYKSITTEILKQNMAYFLRAIIPTAEKLGIKMCVHPDDPPFSILGLPRIVSTEADLNDVVNACPSPSNGITFCTGSLGANAKNDLPGIVQRLGEHFHFLHLRNVQREADGSFFEADHLAGSTDMYAVMKNIILEQKKRMEKGRSDISIPMRPDHGHKLLDDYRYDTYPGYSIIGRLKGLAELRGLEMGIKRTLLDNC